MVDRGATWRGVGEGAMCVWGGREEGGGEVEPFVDFNVLLVVGCWLLFLDTERSKQQVYILKSLR